MKYRGLADLKKDYERQMNRPANEAEEKVLAYFWNNRHNEKAYNAMLSLMEQTAREAQNA